MAAQAATPLDLAIATVAVSLWNDPTTMCGLLKWCAQAHMLSAIVPRSEVAVLTPHTQLLDCPSARLLAWDSALEHKLTKYTQRTSIVGRQRDARWLAAGMQKVQFLALQQYRAIFFTDWDVDPAPSLPRARVAWAQYFPEFLADPTALLLGSPDEGVPLNAGDVPTPVQTPTHRMAAWAPACMHPNVHAAGVFLVKTACAAHALALEWLANGSNAVCVHTYSGERGHIM